MPPAHAPLRMCDVDAAIAHSASATAKRRSRPLNLEHCMPQVDGKHPSKRLRPCHNTQVNLHDSVDRSNCDANSSASDAAHLELVAHSAREVMGNWNVQVLPGWPHISLLKSKDETRRDLHVSKVTVDAVAREDEDKKGFETMILAFDAKLEIVAVWLEAAWAAYSRLSTALSKTALLSSDMDVKKLTRIMHNSIAEARTAAEDTLELLGRKRSDSGAFHSQSIQLQARAALYEKHQILTALMQELDAWQPLLHASVTELRQAASFQSHMVENTASRMTECEAQTRLPKAADPLESHLSSVGLIW